MPNSPLGREHTTIWGEAVLTSSGQPSTAQPFFPGLPVSVVSFSHYRMANTSQGGRGHQAQDQDPSPWFNPSRDEMDGDDDRDGGDDDHPRKKRAQVRVACTNCQKACKRCSDAR